MSKRFKRFREAVDHMLESVATWVKKARTSRFLQVVSRLAGVLVALAVAFRFVRDPAFRLGIGVLASCVLAVLLVRQYLAPSGSSFQEKKEFVQLLAQVIGGGALLVGLFFTWRSLENARQSLTISQEGQLTERFTRAIEQLGNERSVSIRLGGIYALERIARDSERDHWPIMEILTAYVRESAPWKSEDDDSSSPKRAADVQAVLTVLARRVWSRENMDQRLDLRRTDLRGGILNEAHLENADLRDSHLEGTNLPWAHMNNFTFLQGAHLEGANLNMADLRGVSFAFAHMKGAWLMGADMQLSFLNGGDFEDAKLAAKLRGAHFGLMNLKGARLELAEGLTWEQLTQLGVDMDEKTTLPPDLEKRRRESSSSAK